METITHTAAKAGGQAELTLATAQPLQTDPDGLVYMAQHGANLITITQQAPAAIACTWPHCPGDHLGNGVRQDHQVAWSAVGVLFAVVIIAFTAQVYRLSTRFTEPASLSGDTTRRQSGRADLGLLLRVVMLVSMALLWWGAGAAVIEMVQLTDTAPAWLLRTLTALFGLSYFSAAVALLVLIRRAEERRVAIERRLGGAWVHAMARKVQS